MQHFQALVTPKRNEQYRVEEKDGERILVAQSKNKYFQYIAIEEDALPCTYAVGSLVQENSNSKKIEIDGEAYFFVSVPLFKSKAIPKEKEILGETPHFSTLSSLFLEFGSNIRLKAYKKRKQLNMLEGEIDISDKNLLGSPMETNLRKEEGCGFSCIIPPHNKNAVTPLEIYSEETVLGFDPTSFFSDISSDDLLSFSDKYFSLTAPVAACMPKPKDVSTARQIVLFDIIYRIIVAKSKITIGDVLSTIPSLQGFLLKKVAFSLIPDDLASGLKKIYFSSKTRSILAARGLVLLLLINKGVIPILENVTILAPLTGVLPNVLTMLRTLGCIKRKKEKREIFYLEEIPNTS